MATSNFEGENKNPVNNNNTTGTTVSNQKDNMENKEVDIQADNIIIPELPMGKSHHVFISYAEVDHEFAYELIERLESAGYKICHHNKDFTPGWPITDNIKHCVMGSVKTIVILSNGSITSPWCSYETEITFYMSMEMRKKILIPLAFENCKIPDHLKPLTRIEYYNEKVDWWTKLLDAINAADEVPTFESGVPAISSQAFGYNPHYSNLEFLVRIKSKSSCIAERISKRYVPEELSRRGIQISLDEFESEKNYLHRLILFRLHCCYYQRCFCILLMVLSFVGFWIPGMIFVTDADYVAVYLGIGLVLTPVVLPVCYLVCSIIRIKKEKQLDKTFSQMNRRMMKHQVMVTYKTSKLRTGFVLHFVYYNYQPCLDHLRTVLEKKRNESKSLVPEESSVNEISDVGCSAGQIDEDQHGSRDCLIQVEDELEEKLKDMLTKDSVEYLRFYLDERLPQSTPSSHTKHVICLCQFVEDKHNLSTA